MPLEEGMFGDLDVAVQVSPRSTVIARLTLAAEAQLHSVIDARRHFDFQPCQLVLASCAGTLSALVANDLAGSGAIAAFLSRGTWPGAAAVARRAELGPFNLDSPRAAERRFLQINFNRAPEAVAARRAAPAPARRAAEESLEQVAEGAE